MQGVNSKLKAPCKQGLAELKISRAPFRSWRGRCPGEPSRIIIVTGGKTEEGVERAKPYWQPVDRLQPEDSGAMEEVGAVQGPEVSSGRPGQLDYPSNSHRRERMDSKLDSRM